MSHPANVPDQLFEDPDAEQRWRARFSAVRLGLPDPARDAPERTVLVSNASGRYELYCWTPGAAQPVQATERTDGTTLGALAADGETLWWFDDSDGDEFGTWNAQPFGSAPGAHHAALPEVAPGYPAGLEVGRRVILAGFSDDNGSRVHLAVPDAEPRQVYQHPNDASVGALSTDETVWVLAHSEHGDSRYPALRALSVADGTLVGELDDTPGRGLNPVAFSPVPGDQRLLVVHERNGRDELLIWDVADGSVTELAIDLPGDLDADFYPDASALLITHTHQGRTTLHRYRLADLALTELPAAPGLIGGALARPDGPVWYASSSAAQPPRLRQLADGRDTVLLAPTGSPAPGSEPLTDVWVDGPGGRIHAFLAVPAGIDPGHVGPLPTVFCLHGGPAAADDDSYNATRAAYLDAGFAVVQVNYRGSTGYGSAWRDAISERIGHTELADVAAVHDHLVAHGIVDAQASVVAGGSWGGYLTLLALGTQPSRWAAGVAAVPVADYVTAYADEMEPLRAYDRALFGGSPEEVPDRYRDSSPLTYVDQVAAPVLITAGENDPRCPTRQIEVYLDALTAQGADFAVYRYDAGHGSMVVEERIRQVACEIAYVRDVLPPRPHGSNPGQTQ